MLFLYLGYICKSYPVTVAILESVVTVTESSMKQCDQPCLKK